MTKFIGFDIESTGIDPMTDRIVTFSIVVDIDGEQEVYEWLINPEVDIPSGASDVHGVTTEVAERDGLPRLDALRDIWESLVSLTSKHEDVILTAYNCPFDLTMLREELKRSGIISPDSQDVEDLVAKVGILDPLVMDKAIDPYRRGSRKLTDVAKHYGFNLTNAHNSTADVEATIFIARSLKGKLKDSVTMSTLMEMQASSKTEQAASLSDYFRRQGREDWQVNGDWPIIRPL